MNKKKAKIISLITIVLLLLTLVPTVIALALEPSQSVSITYQGENVSAMLLNLDDKKTLKAEPSLDGELAYQWQILANTTAADWVDIQGKDEETCDVTYALVANLLDELQEARLRCVVSDGEETYISNHVTVAVIHESKYTVQSVGYKAPAANLSASLLNDEEINKLYNITINFLYKDGSIARESDVLSLSAGNSVKLETPIPDIVGYTPELIESYDYVEIIEQANGAFALKLSYDALLEPEIINVVYMPALTEFKVHHHRQNLLDDNYETKPFLTETLKGYTGEPIPDCHKDFEGFHALYYERMSVAADKSTQVEIYYDRDYYLVNFNLNGGFGVDPIYTRYGSEIGVNTPVRPGYVFTGWTLTSVNGRAPTADEINEYLFTESKPQITVNSALSYTANWEEGHTTYTMVFWQENANDDGYSYWGSMIVDENENGDPLVVGDTVSAKDWISKLPNIDDEQYFTFNPERSDAEKVLKGDGSTIINVYYVRNRYTITFIAKGECILDEHHSHTDDCYHAVCGKQHVHTEDCVRNLTCTTPEHTEHTSECVDCGVEEHIHGVHCSGEYSCGKTEHTHSSECCTLTEHTHTANCYSNVGSAVSSPATSGWPNYDKFPSISQNGYIAKFQQSSWMGGRTYHYIYINGTWYNYSGTANTGTVVGMSCGLAEHSHSNANTCIHCSIEEHTHGPECLSCDKTEHKHSESCYKDQLHTHTEECYEYIGCEQHVHEDSCLFLDCDMPTGHTHTSSCSDSNRESTVKLVTRKYQASLADIWPIIDENGVAYNSGERWSPSDSTYYDAVLVYISSMPADDFTLTVNTSNYNTYRMHYMLEVLPGEEYTKTYDGKNFKEEFVVNANYNYITREEDFFDIDGFEQYASNPSFSNNQIKQNGGGDVYFYYKRNTGGNIVFKFQNVNTVVKSYTGDDIMYGFSLSDYQYGEDGELFVPPYPDVYEKNAYKFDKWFTTPECFPGTEVNWDTLTMPNGALTLYAHWVPVKHTVKIFKDATLTEQLGETAEVEHGTLIPDPTHPTNGQLIFSGWFYKDDNGVEKAFVFNGIPVKDSLNIYAKWGSRVAVQYTIYYKVKNADGTEAEIALPTIGSTIAGQNKTFDAKGGYDLYEGYREGYFPETRNHSIVMSAEDVNEHTFYYVRRDAVPYTVRYLDEDGNPIIDENGEPIPDKVVADNRFSVVTETFLPIKGYLPNFYQQRLVISANEQEKNVLEFRYVKDETHAYYRVVHYQQNLDGKYVEYSYTDIKALVGSVCAAGPISITGFDFAEARLDGNVVSLDSSGHVRGTLSENGMLIAFYYNRKTVEYTVSYVEYNNQSNELMSTVTKNGLYGAVVEEHAPDLTAKGYTRVSDATQRITLKETGANHIFFQYRENEVTYRYVNILGDTLSESYPPERVGAMTGNPEGCEPVVLEDYTFVGWFVDEACTVPVNPEIHPIELGANNKLTPQKSDSDGDGNYLHEGAKYYAKYNYNFTSLSITVAGATDSDQTFLFTVEGIDGGAIGFKTTVAICGNGTVTLDELHVGNYRVTQVVDWSWRYDVQGNTVAELRVFGASGAALTFTQNRLNGQWLDGNGYSQIIIP